MKRYLVGAVVLLSLVIGTYFMTQASQEQSQASVSKSLARTVTIPVEGMSCMSCVARLKRALKSIDGVIDVEVSLEHREARVYYLDTKVSPQHFVDAINSLGYKAGTPKSEATN